MTGVLIVNDRPIILDTIDSISKVFLIPKELRLNIEKYFSITGENKWGFSIEFKTTYYHAGSTFRVPWYFEYETKELAEFKLLTLVNAVNHTLTNLPKIEL